MSPRSEPRSKAGLRLLANGTNGDKTSTRFHQFCTPRPRFRSRNPLRPRFTKRIYVLSQTDACLVCIDPNKQNNTHYAETSENQFVLGLLAYVQVQVCVFSLSLSLISGLSVETQCGPHLSCADNRNSGHSAEGQLCLRILFYRSVSARQPVFLGFSGSYY